MKKTIASNNNTEPNIAAVATLPPLPTDVLLWNDYQFPREINNNDISEDNTPTISGKGEPGMTAVIDLGDGQSVRVPVNAEGNWSWTPAPALADGTYSWSVALEDAAGNRGESTAPVTFIVDTVGNAVSISHAEDNTGTLTNPLASGSSTDDLKPVIMGTATPGSLVTLYVDGEAVGTMTADPTTGAWAIEINPALESGKTYEITAGEFSGPGETPPPTRPFLLTIDTVVPTGTFDRVSDDVGRYQGDLPNPAVTDDTTPTLHGTGRPGDIVFVRNGSDIISSVTVGTDGRWEYTLPEQTNGAALDVSVVFRGPTGVESAPTDPWKLVIDTEAPVKPIIGDVEDDQGPVIGPINNGDVTDDTQPVFSGEGAVPGETVELIIDDEVVGTAIVGEDGKWEVTPENPLAEGEHEAVVVITDPAGNTSEPSDPIGFIVDTTPPVKPTIDTVFDDAGQQTGYLQNGDITDDSTPTFAGSAEENSLVYIIVNGREVASVRATDEGTWTWTPPLGLANGHYDVKVVAEDKAGLRSDPSDAFSFDLLAGGIPTAPAITDVIDDVESHVGTVQNGGITNDDRPVITGTAQDGTTVYLYDGANPNPIGSAVVTGGRWTIEFDSALAQGEHRFRAVAEDVTGNRSPETGEWVIIVDSVAPGEAADVELWDDFGTPGLIGNNDTTDDNTPTYRGKGEAGGTAIIDLGNGTTVRVPVDGSGNWSYTPAPALADGDYTWKVSIEDKAGNVGPASDPIHFIVDTSGNGVSISHVVDDEGAITGNLGSGSHTDDTTPTVVGRATPGALVKVYVDGNYIDSVRADAVTGSWQLTITPALSTDGTYQITATEDPGTGDSAPTAPFELTLDTSIPTGTLDRIADDVGLVQGDLANPAVTDDTTPTLHGTGRAGDTVFIYDGTTLVNSVTVGNDGTWNYTLPPQNNGTELSLSAVFQSPTGVKSAPTAPWDLTIDTDAPTAPTITGMYDDAGTLIVDGGRSRDTTPELRGTAEKNSLVTIYGSDSKNPIASVYADADGNWTWTSPVLADAKHDFYVTSQDAAGNVSGESNHYGLEVDTRAAAPIILGAYDDVEGGIYNGLVPDGGLSNDGNMQLRGTAEPNSVVYIYNAYNNAVLDTVKTDAKGNWTWDRAVADTAAGRPHMFYTIAKDDLGNVSGKSETYSINVDTVNATPVITGAYDNVEGGIYNGLVGNGGVTNDRTPELRGTAEAGSVVYFVNMANGATVASTTAGADGKWSYQATTNYNQTYSWQVFSIDNAGNRSANSSTFSLTVDTVNNAPVITGSYDDVQGGVYNGLVGNGGVTNDRGLDLRGTAEAGSVVYIIDPATGGTYGSAVAAANGAWSYPVTTNYNKLYEFQAYSIDRAGNRSATSSKFGITVDTVNNAPVITGSYDDVQGGVYNGLVGNGGVTNDRGLDLRGTAEAGSVVYIIDPATGGTYGSAVAAANGAWSYPVTTNYNKLYEFQAYSIDRAGNRSATSSKFGITVDTVNAAPVITSVTDNVGPVTGNVANAGSTDDNTPTLNGTAEAGSTVYIAVNGSTYSVTAAANGSWSLTPSALPLGNHTFSVFSIDKAGNQSTGVSRSLTIAPPMASGYEDFTGQRAGTFLGGNPTTSGFKVLAGGSEISTTLMGVNTGNPFLFIRQGSTGTTFTVGDTDQISFQLTGWGIWYGGALTSIAPANVKFYNAAGKEIGSLSGVGRTGSEYVNFNFKAPAGEVISKVTIVTNDGSGLALDNIAWGTQAASRSAGRSMSMLMNAEEQHDDSASVVSTLNDREINLDNLQHKTIDITNSKQDKLNISLHDVLTHAEKDLFITDGNKQLMVQGNKGDVVNLSDLLPDNSDPGNWTNAGNVKVSGVEYQVFHMESQDVELLVQAGVTVNVNNH
ncbi:Ig-like domain-containing protein [Enterobacter ludwigii]|uniref:Ig-like domain-containing protein n=1 Tax=Enterobacter ludwigii TaxID=299767 RepID=UPI00234D78C3|nr:Ig-like domain-containing protein [Enterobacter ludwigii]MDC7314572.1 Ig-like domain-containing protein [Enterobacter ludwigii]MDI0401479.1 Ig-like domain-containing protein [Enterobacter ludwigii]MDI0411886.1 Ig-like domain-containing protein [Enterobacter ludwigii]MDI0416491.1 Ig-like domain-containing protein [Enterobacter ludwigii]MDI0429031.1 Ig-like domain-containing protein [Enterobacter ludwigii]